MTKQWTFDSKLTRDYTKVRQEFATEFLQRVSRELELTTALDVGCGIGLFSNFLSELGFRVVAVDGREENAAEGRRRYPEIKFVTKNAEDPSLPDLGQFDFVLCVGLLYHLENPFVAIRNLYSLTGQVLLVESMCSPGQNPGLDLLDEHQADNQGLNYIAFYPTEPCLVKMLYRAGFPFVYRFARLPRDPQFRDTVWRKRSRYFLAASKVKLVNTSLILAKEPFRLVPGPSDPWTTRLSRMRQVYTGLSKVRSIARRFIRPWRESRRRF